MFKIGTKINGQTKKVYFECDETTLLQEYYESLFKLLTKTECSNGILLCWSFTFINNGNHQKGRYDYELIEFLNNFGYDLDNVELNFVNCTAVGGTAYIPDLISISINANEGKHHYSPHVHISRLRKKINNYRIHLETMTQMRGDKEDWAKEFNSSERNAIINCLIQNKDTLIDYYQRVIKGEYIEKGYFIEYDGKKYILK